MEEEELCKEWYFDFQHRPVCSEFWPHGQCAISDCAFSHQIPSYIGFVPIEDIEKQSTEDSLIKYLQEYALANREALKCIGNPEQDRDITEIDSMLSQMQEFAKGPISANEMYQCPYLTETGNCMYGASCAYAHGEEKVGLLERSEEWYPASQDCQICNGFKFSIQPNGCERCLGS